MKRLIFFCVAVSLSLVANAQKSGVYLRTGMNFAKVTASSQGASEIKSLVSFQVGFTGDIAINKYFSLQPSLIFTGKGAKLKRQINGDIFYKATGNPFYVEMPLNAIAKIPFPKKNLTLFAGAGPYIAVGVTGKRKIDGNFSAGSYQHKDNIRFTNDDFLALEYEEYAGLGVMRRIDYGYNGMAGAQYKRYFLAFNYSWGKAESQKNIGEFDEHNRHRVFSVLFGYKLF